MVVPSIDPLNLGVILVRCYAASRLKAMERKKPEARSQNPEGKIWGNIRKARRLKPAALTEPWALAHGPGWHGACDTLFSLRL